MQVENRLSKVRVHEQHILVAPWYNVLFYRIGVTGVGLYSRKGKRRQRSEDIGKSFVEFFSYTKNSIDSWSFPLQTFKQPLEYDLMILYLDNVADILFAEATTLNDHFLMLIHDVLFAEHTGGAIKGTLIQGPVKRADRALQKTVRKAYVYIFVYLCSVCVYVYVYVVEL